MDLTQQDIGSPANLIEIDPEVFKALLYEIIFKGKAKGCHPFLEEAHIVMCDPSYAGFIDLRFLDHQSFKIPFKDDPDLIFQ